MEWVQRYLKFLYGVQIYLITRLYAVRGTEKIKSHFQAIKLFETTVDIIIHFCITFNPP